MAKVSIQIVNYKTKKYLDECLESISNDLASADFLYEILILDNYSGDDLSDLEKKYSTVRFYYSGKNGGFGFGHNFLARKGEGEYILILNPDIKIIQPETIARLLELAEKTGASVVGPRLINEKGQQAWDHGELGKNPIKNKLGLSLWKVRKTRGEVAWISGAVFLIKRAEFERIGGFDEKFFLYREEEDLCLRLRQIGSKIIYDPAIEFSLWVGRGFQDQIHASFISLFFKKAF